MENNKCEHCAKHKHRTEKEYKSLVNRLNRIEGQIRGIKGMLEKDAYCPDILVQVAAANAALNAFNKELLANHTEDYNRSENHGCTRLCDADTGGREVPEYQG